MSFPRSYNLIREQEKVHVMPGLNLEVANNPNKAIQYYDFDDNQWLAVHSLRPYGERTGPLNSINKDTDLVPVKYQGDDYSLFKLPEDLLTLSSATLGSGKTSMPELIKVYNNLGHWLGKMSLKYEMNQWQISNMAILRKTGLVVCVPPFNFKTGATDEAELTVKIDKFLIKAFTSYMPENKINRLKKVLLKGMNRETSPREAS